MSIKKGCGSSVCMGHGEYAICGKNYYGEIYLCDKCKINQLEDDKKKLLKKVKEEKAKNEAFEALSKKIDSICLKKREA